MRYILYVFTFAVTLTSPVLAETCLSTTVSGSAIADDRLQSFCSSDESLSNDDDEDGAKEETSTVEK